ncbi:hypothetical protein VTJ04DRAFT_7049 [Mycothermus thermophilus]|uniref:uncharacterized protein n=1 Tax=Humicola insolens TaxID=85995 RepID=UPI0037421969
MVGSYSIDPDTRCSTKHSLGRVPVNSSRHRRPREHYRSPRIQFLHRIPLSDPLLIACPALSFGYPFLGITITGTGHDFVLPLQAQRQPRTRSIRSFTSNHGIKSDRQHSLTTCPSSIFVSELWSMHIDSCSS